MHTLYICVAPEQYCVKFLLQSKLKFCKKSRIFLTKNSHFLSKRRFLTNFSPIFAVFDNLKLFPVASAVRSDSVRRPIRFRPPSDQIPSAARSDSVRSPIRFRSPSDQIPFAVRSDSVRRRWDFTSATDKKTAKKQQRIKRLPSRGCTCLKCTNQANNAPTKQAMPSALLVQLRQLHPLEVSCGFGGYLQGGALVSSAPTKQAMHQPNNNGFLLLGRFGSAQIYRD